MSNTFAKCISSQCEKYSICRRAISENSAKIDYLRIDEGECIWYDEIKVEVETVGSEDDSNNERMD